MFWPNMRRRCSTCSAQHFEQNSVAKRVGYKISKSQVPQVPFFNQEPKIFFVFEPWYIFFINKIQSTTKPKCNKNFMSRNTTIQLDSIYSGFIHLLFRISSSLDLQQIDGSGWSRLNSSTNGSNCVFNGVQNEQSEPEISTERRNALMNKPSETDQPIHGNVRMP